MASTGTQLPIHSTPNSTSASTQETNITIPDGRRNSKGEALPSPTTTWKPNFNRTQSWNKQDFKREILVGELEKENKVAGAGTPGEFMGFTEAGKEAEVKK